MASGTTQSNVPSWLSSDNIAKLAFTLPFIPLLVIVAWKAGLFDGPSSSSKKNQAYDPKTGIGRGAPGFQTNVRRVAVPRSELHKYNLSPEEEARILQQNGGMLGTARANSSGPLSPSSSSKSPEVNEWIPDGHQSNGKKGGNTGKAVRKRK